MRYEGLPSLMDDTRVEALRPDVEPGPPPSHRLKKVAATLAVLFVALLLSAAVFKPYINLYPLYWLHDHVWLPLKGQTFTRFYPVSWIWWGTAALLGFLMLAECFLHRFPLRRTQIWFLRLILRSQDPEAAWMPHFLVLKAASFCLTQAGVVTQRATEAIQGWRRKEGGP